MQKINGLSRTPHPYQIIAYVFFSSLILSYYFIIFPLSAKTEKIVSIIIETIAGIGVIISGYLATSIDPSDPFLQLSRKARFENKPYEPPAREFYCGADHTYVRSTSKHCRRCARCTEEFDHHCKWINNDVGKANYKAFFMMISTVMVFLVAYLVFAIILTVNYANDNMLMTNDTYLYHDDKDRILAGMVIMWIIMVPSAAFLILDTNLVLFHIFLKMKGLTTFQYITIVEERKEHMKELEEAIKMLGGNRKTCLDFVLCLRKRKPRDPNMNDKKDSAKTAEIELGRTSSLEKKKVSELLDDNKNENRSISKIGVEETPAPTPQIAHANSPSSKHHGDASPNSSPNNPLNIYPVGPESPTKEREANISREVNYNGSEPVVVNISRDNGKMRTSDKKHTISQITMEINKEEEEAQARHDIKILTPNSSKPRMSTYSMAGEEVPVVSNKNTRGSQIVEIKMQHVTSETVDLKRPKRSDSKRKESYNDRNDDLEGKPENYRGAGL